MMRQRARSLEGWSIVAWASVAALVIAGALFAREGIADAGLRAGLRGTAMLAAAIFLVVFVASSWNALRPSAASKYLLRNRRYLGVSVAASMAAHAALFSTLAARDPAAFFAGISGVTLVGGSLGYVMLALMTATSFDRTAAWVGRAWWKRLHTAGMYFLWVIFAFTYVGRAAASPWYGALAAALLGAMGVRVGAAVRRTRGSGKRAREKMNAGAGGGGG